MELGWRELGSQVKETTLPSPQQKVHDGVPFPLILTPTNSDDFPTIESTLEWMRKKRAAVEEKLLKYGAVLFRGFPLQEASHFNDFVNIFEYDPLPYIGGSAPRNQVRWIDVYLVKLLYEYNACIFSKSAQHCRTFPMITGYNLNRLKIIFCNTMIRYYTQITKLMKTLIAQIETLFIRIVHKARWLISKGILDVINGTL